MLDEIKGKTDTKKSTFGDFCLGVLAFIGLVVLFGIFASFMRGSISSFSVSLIFYGGGACFVGLLVVSIRAKRPGLILGFVGAIVLSILALAILLLSICGGGWH